MPSKSHPGHHHFFIIFPTPFYIDFDSILAPNLEPKSTKNPSKMEFKTQRFFNNILY